MNSGESKTFSHWNCDRKASADRRDLKGSILVCLFDMQVEILHGDLIQKSGVQKLEIWESSEYLTRV